MYWSPLASLAMDKTGSIRLMRLMRRPARRLRRSVRRAAQIRSALEFRDIRWHLGLHRCDPAALDTRGFDPAGYFCLRSLRRARVPWRMQRARPRHCARQQHLRRALMPEIAIGEAHARYGPTEAALISPVEIETGFEGNALDGSAHRLAADLQRIPRQPHVTNWTGAAELHRASRAHVVEYPACAASAIE